MQTADLSFQELERRRKHLGMSHLVLARRAGVSLTTVQRILSGRHQGARIDHVAAIADALGMGREFPSKKSAEDMRERQAEQKAKQLVDMVQGTAGLEGQAIDAHAMSEMVRRTMHELLAGPKRSLWGS
jgi:transcriptional regulator with XRE-family HTH domain